MTRLNTWTEEVNERVRIVLSQIEQINDLFQGVEVDESLVEEMTAPYRDILASLYTEDLQLAKILDNSDFVIGARGENIGHGQAPVSVMINLLTKAREQTIKVAKSILDATGREGNIRLQPNFTGYAPGSVYLGFSAPEPGPDHLFPEDDVVYDAVKSALRVLGTMSVLVASGASAEEIAEAVPDPARRDAGFNAVLQFAPSRQSGIDAIVIGSKVEDTTQPASFKQTNAQLSFESRQQVRTLVEKPAQRTEVATFRGLVREIDLDQRRFQLREIDGLESISLRCAYADYLEDKAKSTLDKLIDVTGLLQRDPAGNPRFLLVQSIGDQPTTQISLFDQGVTNG